MAILWGCVWLLTLRSGPKPTSGLAALRPPDSAPEPSTAVLPATRTQVLRIQQPFVPLTERERRQALQMLPQSHTCANTLDLPNYWQALLQVRGTASLLPAVSLGGGGWLSH